jgi:hypothetical protein
VIADGGYRGNPEVVIPYRKPTDGRVLPAWKEDRNAVHRTVRACVEHTLARLKVYKILRDYRRAAHTLATTASVSPPVQHRPRRLSPQPSNTSDPTELRDVL